MQKNSSKKHTLLLHWLRESLWLCVDHNKLWKILKEMWILDHFICLLRSLYAGQEATVRSRHGKRDWFKIRKGVHQGSILSTCIFFLTYMQSTSCEMWGWMKHKLESRLLGEITKTSDMHPRGGKTAPRHKVKEGGEGGSPMAGMSLSLISIWIPSLAKPSQA